MSKKSENRRIFKEVPWKKIKSKDSVAIFENSGSFLGVYEVEKGYYITGDNLGTIQVKPNRPDILGQMLHNMHHCFEQVVASIEAEEIKPDAIPTLIAELHSFGLQVAETTAKYKEDKPEEKKD